MSTVFMPPGTFCPMLWVVLLALYSPSYHKTKQITEKEGSQGPLLHLCPSTNKEAKATVFMPVVAGKPGQSSCYHAHLGRIKGEKDKVK